MQHTSYTVVSCKAINHKSCQLELDGPENAISAPGQFVNILVEDKYLRRPISVADYQGGRITLIIDIVGDGTKWLSQRRPGDVVDVLTGLGNGFSLQPSSKRPFLISGGIGVAPLVGLARLLKEKGFDPIAVIGFNAAADVSCTDLFAEINVECHVATMQGDYPGGFKGNALDAALTLTDKPEYFYACGPLPMMKALCERMDCPGELSLDARMGCGFGACMCCSVQTLDGPKRICKEGPVFFKDNLVWK